MNHPLIWDKNQKVAIEIHNSEETPDIRNITRKGNHGQ